jgi:hypothetical protein
MKFVECPAPNYTSGNGSFGDLYTCIVGQAQTVKVFINETPGTINLKNVKLMWNDWTERLSYNAPIHADKAYALDYVTKFAKLYAPALSKQLTAAFVGNVNLTFDTPSYRIDYTYSHGPSIDERMLVVTPKN